MTTLPRNWLSDIGWPNWLRSRKSGAGLSPERGSEVQVGVVHRGRVRPVDDEFPACEPDVGMGTTGGQARQPAEDAEQNHR